MTELPIHAGSPDDWPAVAALMWTAFHQSPDEDSERLMRSVNEPARSLLVRDRDAVVAHASAYTRDLTVPGTTMPAAHISMVAVAPTHRRRRLLTRLMHRQLVEVPEPVAVLWASEGQIYPRFGYGLASRRVSLSIESREVRLPESTGAGRLRLVAPARARPELARVYEAARPLQPGWSSRDARWWSHRVADPPGHREGATELRATLHESAAGVDGYALWRVRRARTAGGPNGEVEVDEVVTTSPDAYLALWRFLLSIDLTRWVTLRLSGPDEPLYYLASEPRRLGATQSDGLFVRIVDLPAALTNRRYAAPVDVVLEVADPLLPANAGRWRLTADEQKATCARTGEPADLACGIGDLSAAFLGGTSLAVLAAGGRVRELRADTVARAATAFGWHRAPAGIEIF